VLLGGNTGHVIFLVPSSDHDFIQQQEVHLLSICQRTMGLSVGRFDTANMSHDAHMIIALCPPLITYYSLLLLSLPRGMFTLSTVHPLPTSPLSSFIPPLNLNGRAVPRDATVGLEHVEKPADMTVWPDFHNGVAAGLCLARSSSKVSGACGENFLKLRLELSIVFWEFSLLQHRMYSRTYKCTYACTHTHTCTHAPQKEREIRVSYVGHGCLVLCYVIGG